MSELSNLIKIIVKSIVFENYNTRVLEKLATKKIEWQNLIEPLSYHELAPFLYLIIKNNPEVVPEEFFIFLKNEYYHQVFRYRSLREELVKILKEAEVKNVLIVPIKGFSISEKYYKKYGFRPLVDIDLLIKEEELSRGALLLETLGYKKILSKGKEEYWRKSQCHLEFIKDTPENRIPLDLHWALDLKKEMDDILPSLWQRINKIDMASITASIPSLEDTIFSLSLHQRRFGKILNLKYIYDMGLILKDSSLIDWDYVFKTARKGHFKASLFFLLAQTQLVLDMDLTKYLQNLEVPLWKRLLIFKFIKKYSYLSFKNDSKVYYLYLLCHFLLHDTIWEPVKYIINIPEEQFAKFYKLPLYEAQTERLYKIRYFYIVYRLIKWLYEAFQGLFRKRNKIYGHAI